MASSSSTTTILLLLLLRLLRLLRLCTTTLLLLLLLLHSNSKKTDSSSAITANAHIPIRIAPLPFSLSFFTPSWPAFGRNKVLAMLLLRLQSCCAPAARPAAPALARRCISTASGVFSAAAAAAGAAGAAGAQPALFTLPHFAAGAPPPPQPLPRGQKPSYDDPIALAMHRLRRGLPKTLHSNELLQEYYAPHAVLISRVGCAVPPHESLRGGASQTDDEHSTGGLADGAAGRGGVTIRGLPLIKVGGVAGKPAMQSPDTGRFADRLCHFSVLICLLLSANGILIHG